jgi:hypothetical protein
MKLLSLVISVALNHISEDHTLLRKTSHTHTLHKFSWLLKNFCLQGNLCSLITRLFFICLSIFDKLSDCFLRFRYMCVLISCWRPNLVLFFYFWFWFWFFLILCLPFVLVWQKGGVFFLFFWTGNVFPNRSSVFCPRMAKGKVC